MSNQPTGYSSGAQCFGWVRLVKIMAPGALCAAVTEPPEVPLTDVEAITVLLLRTVPKLTTAFVV